MQEEPVEDRLDLGEVGDLVDQRFGVIAEEGMGSAPARTGRQSVEERSFSGGRRSGEPWRAPVACRNYARWVAQSIATRVSY
jgi:hypothetical protein